jgi:plasmid stabilization system protein ParE
MKRHKVVFLPTAITDMQTSYDWGCRVWGVEEANKWARKMSAACLGKLSSMPERFPLAPENEQFDVTVRQMVVGRYRVLFTITGKTINIFHIQGAYIGSEEEAD